MASVATSSMTPIPNDPASHRRATADEQRAALSLLMTGRVRPHDPAVDQFIQFAAEQTLCLDELWASFVHRMPVAAALITPAAGRAGMLFMSPPTTDANRPREATLIRTACAAQDPHRIRLVQALLDPFQKAHERTLLDAGFSGLASLIYMQGPIVPPRHSVMLESGLEVHAWSRETRPIFAESILASYESTLDCPGLLGLRHIDDILAGHIASGIFTPELWTAVTHQGKPVGVALINLSTQPNTAELVYLGLSPPWRGRGLGKKMLLRGMSMASLRQAGTLMLAVDDRNKSAMRLYESMRFVSTTRKVALIFPVG